MNINFPLAQSGFEPPLFKNTAKWDGRLSGIQDLENSFKVLYRTLQILGHDINQTEEPDIIFHWCGKGLNYKSNSKLIILEHGWIPRWSYQMSNLGTNSQGHYATAHIPNTYLGMSKEKIMKTMNSYLINLQNIYKLNLERFDVTYPFILVPFQLATDINLKQSNTEFAKYYKTSNLEFAQALIDYIYSFNLPYHIIFKQHPTDSTDLTKLKIRAIDLLISASDKISVHSLFATGQCKLTIGINSNTLHEALIWRIPVIALGDLIWHKDIKNRPLEKDVNKFKEAIQEYSGLDSKVYYYLYHIIRNQWFLSDFQNPLIVQRILDTCGTCEAYQTRKELSL